MGHINFSWSLWKGPKSLKKRLRKYLEESWRSETCCHLYIGKNKYQIKGLSGSPSDWVANVLDCDIVVSKFELQSRS